MTLMSKDTVKMVSPTRSFKISSEILYLTGLQNDNRNLADLLVVVISLKRPSLVRAIALYLSQNL